MGPAPMIIVAVTFQNPAEMIFIEHDHMVETLSPETSNYSLREWILPGTPGRRDRFFDAHPLNPPAKLRSVNLVTVSEQVARSTPVLRQNSDLQQTLDFFLCAHKTCILGDADSYLRSPTVNASLQCWVMRMSNLSV